MASWDTPPLLVAPRLATPASFGVYRQAWPALHDESKPASHSARSQRLRCRRQGRRRGRRPSRAECCGCQRAGTGGTLAGISRYLKATPPMLPRHNPDVSRDLLYLRQGGSLLLTTHNSLHTTHNSQLTTHYSRLASHGLLAASHGLLAHPNPNGLLAYLAREHQARVQVEVVRHDHGSDGAHRLGGVRVRG